jgi:serine/threonine-protein kinase/endoribonuclease IRE1
VGTTGWQAPEVLALRQRQWDREQPQAGSHPRHDGDGDGGDDRPSFSGGVGATSEGDLRAEAMAADLWSCGCVFFHLMTRGSHPFGEKWFEREANVAQGRAVGGCGFLARGG